MSDLNIIRAMTCVKHGVSKWQGHLYCADCGTLYQARDPQKSQFVPETCACGAALRGESVDWLGIGNGVDGARARTMCFHCFRYFTKHGGRVPVEQIEGN